MFFTDNKVYNINIKIMNYFWKYWKFIWKNTNREDKNNEDELKKIINKKYYCKVLDIINPLKLIIVVNLYNFSVNNQFKLILINIDYIELDNFEFTDSKTKQNIVNNCYNNSLILKKVINGNDDKIFKLTINKIDIKNNLIYGNLFTENDFNINNYLNSIYIPPNFIKL